MGITMDLACHGFEADLVLEREAAQDLVSLTPFGAVLRSCRVDVSLEGPEADPAYCAKLRLTLCDGATETVPARGRHPIQAVREAFAQAQRRLVDAARRRRAARTRGR